MAKKSKKSSQKSGKKNKETTTNQVDEDDDFVVVNPPLKIPKKSKKKGKNRISVWTYILGTVGALVAIFVAVGFNKDDGRDPALSHTLHQRGLSELKRNQINQAIATLQQCIQADPTMPHGYNSLAGALRMAGRSKEAFKYLDEGEKRVTEAHGKDFEDLSLIAQGKFFVLRDQGRKKEAVESIKRAIELKPAAGHYVAWAGVEGVDNEVELYDKALELEPNDIQAFCLRVHSYTMLGQWELAEEAQQTLDKYMKYVLQSTNIDLNVCLQPYHASYMNITAELMRETAVMYARREAFISGDQRLPKLFPNDVEPLYDENGQRLRKLRVGYLSSDLGNHPVGRNMLGVMIAHNKENFDWYCFSTKEIQGDPIQATMRQHCTWVDISLTGNHAVVAKMIRNEYKIDVLVDLNGWTALRRLQVFAARPSPIQMSHGLGFVGTTGAKDCFDFFITDAVATPPRFDSYYTENIVRVEQAYLPAAHKKVHITEQGADFDPSKADKMQLRAENGLPTDENKFMYCSFQSMHKISKASFYTWMEILNQSPDTVLWMANHKPAAEELLKLRAEESGVDPSRLIFSKGEAPGVHLVRAQACDLMLDSWPYNAHSTATDSLWAGVPLVVYLPDYHVPTAEPQTPKMCSRVSASLLHTLGMSNLIQSTVEDFISAAVELSKNKELYNGIRETLLTRRMKSRLYNLLRYAQTHERAYEELFHRFMRGEDPAPLDVADLRAAEK